MGTHIQESTRPASRLGLHVSELLFFSNSAVEPVRVVRRHEQDVVFGRIASIANTLLPMRTWRVEKDLYTPMGLKVAIYNLPPEELRRITSHR